MGTETVYPLSLSLSFYSLKNILPLDTTQALITGQIFHAQTSSSSLT